MLGHALRILLLNLLLLPTVWAGNTLALVLSDSSAPYREFAQTFSRALQESSWQIASTGKIETIDSSNPPALIVTAGVEAFRQTLARPGNTPILATLIGRQLYERILAEAAKSHPRSSAIYIEQPLNRQVAFLRLLLPGRQRVGILLSSESSNSRVPLRQALLAGGLALDSEESDGDENLLPAVNALLPRVNLLLATPDSKVYKRDNIKSILLTSYRHQKPVIAFSSTFVNAGALAAIYSTPQQIARQAADLINDHGSNLPVPEYPQQFSIAINRSVAAALDLSLPDESELKRALMAGKETR